jgi:hypothetical protein
MDRGQRLWSRASARSFSASRWRKKRSASCDRSRNCCELWSPPPAKKSAAPGVRSSVPKWRAPLYDFCDLVRSACRGRTTNAKARTTRFLRRCDRLDLDRPCAVEDVHHDRGRRRTAVAQHLPSHLAVLRAITPVGSVPGTKFGFLNVYNSLQVRRSVDSGTESQVGL